MPVIHCNFKIKGVKYFMIKSRITETVSNLQALSIDAQTILNIDSSARVIVDSIKAGNNILICGNGGSAADAQHIAGEFVCRFYKDREPLPAIALSTDTSVITSISNDYMYSHIFSRQVKAIGRKGDILLGISTSGSSQNILEAFKTARTMEIKTILLTGLVEREVAGFSDIVISVPSSDTPRIQEMHLVIEHIICEIVEEQLFPI
jgi:D-sedoheptulose 7-phosphate isomerase